MRILVACSMFSFSSREEIQWFQKITTVLRKQNHEVDTFLLPVVDNPLLLPEQLLATRLLNIENSCDLLITIGYPAFALIHPRKSALLFSLVSSLHECFNTEYGILATPQYYRIRNAVINAERNCLSEAVRIICASNTLASKIKDDYKLKPVTLLLGDISEKILKKKESHKGELWVVCETNLEPLNRIDLLLDSVAQSNGQWKLKIFVPSASSVYRNALQERIKRLRIKEKVMIINEALSENALTTSSALISLNYMAMRIPGAVFRAIKASVPVLTLTDSGALLEVVIDKETGFVVAPSVQKISQTLDQITTAPHFCMKPSSKLQQTLENSVDVGKLIKVLVV